MTDRPEDTAIQAECRRVNNEDLKVGDTIEAWWTPNHADTITAIRPYTGPLDCVFAIAEFAINRSGMSLTVGGDCIVLNRAGGN